MAADDVLCLDNQLCFAFYAATRAIMQAYQPLLEELGLTYPQYIVMLVLWENDGLSVSEIGERLYLDSGTLTPLLKRMEAAGLVSRARSERDERVVLVHLTSAGQRLKKRARTVPEQLFCRLQMAPEDFLRLRGDVKRLFESIRDSGPHTESTAGEAARPTDEGKRS
jgi:DNA-binding MarR family transcriptional regulator